MVGTEGWGGEGRTTLADQSSTRRDKWWAVWLC